MKSLLQNLLSIIGASTFLFCMGMLLTRPTNFAAYVPEMIEIGQEKLENPKVRIVLDAGHGGRDGGSVHKPLLEKELTMRVVRMIRERLVEEALSNVEVVLTREGDEYRSLHQRVGVANRYPKAYFVSVHFNGSEYRSAHGTETFYADPKPTIIQNQIRRRLQWEPGVPLIDTRGRRFAETVQRALVERIGSRDRGIRNNPKLVLPREVIGPSILVECVFLSNPKEAARLQQPGALQAIADGIAEGVIAYVRETEGDPYAWISTEQVIDADVSE